MSPLARLHPTTEAVEASGLILRRGELSTVSPEIAQSERSRVSKEPGAVQEETAFRRTQASRAGVQPGQRAGSGGGPCFRPHPRDITSQTQTPAARVADATERWESEVPSVDVAVRARDAADRRQSCRDHDLERLNSVAPSREPAA
jgi:hypothetical protein